MPDENRVFDVARPGKVGAGPTSKPVIVGHRPTIADPMVRDDKSGPTHIVVQESLKPLKGAAEASDTKDTPVSSSTNESSLFTSPGASSPMLSHENEPALVPPADVPEAEPQGLPAGQASAVFPTNEPLPASDSSTLSMESDGRDAAGSEPAPAPNDSMPPGEQEPVPEEPAHVEGLHVAEPKRRKPLKFIILGLLILLAAAYLLVDAGVVGSNINLPFHIFKQKTPAPAASNSTTNNNQSQANTANIPAGFTEYKLAGTNVTFAAPTTWGTPTSSTDPGYSIRGGTNKSDGTYAYLVDFSTNKDVEIAVTSSKYLPVSRASLYYDYLQWCKGTNDGKIYETIMHTTIAADKTETPSTTTCDQGPVTATELDSTTIVQLKAKSTDGKVVGDIYTKNLQATDLPVFRMKDATSNNAGDIKQLLDTVRISS